MQKKRWPWYLCVVFYNNDSLVYIISIATNFFGCIVLNSQYWIPKIISLIRAATICKGNTVSSTNIIQRDNWCNEEEAPILHHLHGYLKACQISFYLLRKCFVLFVSLPVWIIKIGVWSRYIAHIFVLKWSKFLVFPAFNWSIIITNLCLYCLVVLNYLFLNSKRIRLEYSSYVVFHRNFTIIDCVELRNFIRICSA